MKSALQFPFKNQNAISYYTGQLMKHKAKIFNVM